MSERFKVGDRVQAVEECAHYFPAGAVGTVVSVNTDDYYVDFDKAPGVHIKASGDTTWFVTDLVAAPMTCKVSAHKEEYRARANDPATSKGPRKVNKYEQAVIDTLFEDRSSMAGTVIPLGLTGKEIALRTGHPLNCITPRFAPLRRKSLIKDSGIKRDKQIVWVLV